MKSNQTILFLMCTCTKEWRGCHYKAWFAEVRISRGPVLSGLHGSGQIFAWITFVLGPAVHTEPCKFCSRLPLRLHQSVFAHFRELFKSISHASNFKSIAFQELSDREINCIIIHSKYSSDSDWLTLPG